MSRAIHLLNTYLWAGTLLIAIYPSESAPQQFAGNFIQQSGLLSLVAGDFGGSGNLDSRVGQVARFNSPNAVAVDSSGNVYVADTSSNTIRKIASGGLVTTLAGSPGVSGSSDGTGAAASFNSPTSLAVDSAGNVYVADASNHTIRKISPGGAVTTLAGTAGSPGSSDGTGAAASFNYPNGVTVDGVGTVYVADTSNYTIRKITSAGVVTTLAGTAGSYGSNDGTGSAASFNSPTAVTVDGSGNVFVTDSNNHTIRRVTSGGVVTTFAGLAGFPGSNDATGSAARFYYPNGVATDSSGNVYVADTFNNNVRKISSGGSVSTLAGLSGSVGATDATGTSARFNYPKGVAVDGSANVFVADTQNNTIRKISSGAVVTTIAGAPTQSGSLDATGASARFNNPMGFAFDSSGNLYLADAANHTIRKITSAGVVTTFAGSAGSFGSADETGSAARFNGPSGIAVDSSNNLFVADTYNHTIRKITPAGAVTTFAGNASFSGSTNATGTAARFKNPTGIAVDASGNLYVADSTDNTIRKITSGAVATTLAGLTSTSGSNDGTGTSARFNSPSGVAVDSSGSNIYVADKFNHTIRKVTSGGAVTTFAGTAGSSGSIDDTGTASRFNSPVGVAVDGQNNVYVADAANNAIRKINPNGKTMTIIGNANASGVRLGSQTSLTNPSGIAIYSRSIYISSLNAILSFF